MDMTNTTDLASLRRSLDSAVAHRRDAIRSGNANSIASAIAAEKAASAALTAARLAR